jgi:hypothetical protein
MILPFIEYDNLYRQFRLDEPWDSPHNKALLKQMPRTYAPVGPNAAKPADRTPYQGFFGKGAFFEGKKGTPIAGITDGTSNTIMVVEAAEQVPWTKPADLPFDPAKPLPRLGGLFPGGFHAAFCDGSVHWIKQGVNLQTLRALITRNGGEVIDYKELE